MHENDLNKYHAVEILDRNKDVIPKIQNKQYLENLEEKKGTAQILRIFEIDDVDNDQKGI